MPMNGWGAIASASTLPRHIEINESMSLKISNQVSIPLAEIQLQAIRAQGAGGQNVNKVSSAVHLRFDIDASSLPDTYKESLRKLSDQRITSDGIIVLKAQRFRSQDKNREDALDRLRELVKAAGRNTQTTQTHQTHPQQPEKAGGQQNKTRPTQIPARQGRSLKRCNPSLTGAQA